MKTKYLIILYVLFFACQNNNDNTKTHSVQKGGTSIEINPNVQLFRIAYNLAIADSINLEYRPCNNLLYQKTQSKFSKFSDLALVQKIRSGDEWNADLPVIALCFDENFNALQNLDNNDIASQ